MILFLHKEIIFFIFIASFAEKNDFSTKKHEKNTENLCFASIIICMLMSSCYLT